MADEYYERLMRDRAALSDADQRRNADNERRSKEYVTYIQGFMSSIKPYYLGKDTGGRIKVNCHYGTQAVKEYEVARVVLSQGPRRVEVTFQVHGQAEEIRITMHRLAEVSAIPAAKPKPEIITLKDDASDTTLEEVWRKSLDYITSAI